MDKSSDQLREEIDAQRSDAGAKIDNLQTQLQTQVEDTRQQVTDTATHVRDEAQAMVTDTVDSVKQTIEGFDIEKTVQERPLVAVGAAMLGGFVLGAMLGGGDNGSRQYSGNYSTGSDTTGGGSSISGLGNSMRSAAQKSGLEDTISNAGAAIMGSLTDQLKGMLDSSFPGFSDKLGTAEQQSGSFMDKAKATQQDGQKQ